MVGEHIRVLKDGRWVHAIDCGDETVLHLSEEAPLPRVRRAYRPEFVAGAADVEIVTHRERTFPAKAIVQRAYSRASDPALASMFRDSESFADWCTTGRVAAPRNVSLDAPSAPSAPPPAAVAPSTTPGQLPTVKPIAQAASTTRLARATPAPPARPKVKAKARPAARVKPKAKATSRRTAPKASKRKLARAKPAVRRGAKPARKAKR